MMEYLTPKYWEKINTDKGTGFENLVWELLSAEYGKKTFQNTKHSWDGSKDFFYYSEHRRLWAECKNYAANIDLKILASTLIMAQIAEIDTVLFFSYSPINVNTKAKLLTNAEKKSKTIYFYDDIALEKKIFQYWNFVGEQFFSDFSYTESTQMYSADKYEAKCLLYGNPLDMGTSIEGYELNHLTLFKMFEMSICIINRENNYNTISIKFKEKKSEIKAQFEVYPEHIINSKMTVSLAPYEGKTIRLWFIPMKENCKIPHPCINGKQLTLPKNVEFKALKLENKNIRRLIGKSYEQCVTDFKLQVLHETYKMKVGVFYGNGGTGKSKLYEECLNISKINGYEIIDYCNMTATMNAQSVQDFIQKLLVNIYDISIDTLEQIFKAISFSENKNNFLSKQPEYCMLSEMFNINNDTDIQKWIDRYLNLIVMKLAKNKFIIAIDNVQFLNGDIINLLDNIYNRLIWIKPCSTKFLFTFNLDYIKRNSEADMFLGSCTSNNAVSFSKHICGFEDSKECFEFLQEVLSIGDVFQKSEVNYIAENMNKNPFYLEQMIYWLRDKHAIELVGNSYSVKNELMLKSLIRNIPDNIYDMLDIRWNYYDTHNVFDSKKILILFSAIHLYKELEKGDVDKLDMSWDTIKELEKKGFIISEYTTNTIVIKFRHDLIEKFFSKMYSSFSKIIIDYENQQNFSLRSNDIRYYFGILYSEDSLAYLSNAQLIEMLNLHIDGRLSHEFYTLIFKKYLDTFDCNYREDKIIWINNIYQIMVCIHDILGNNSMKKCVDILQNKLRENEELFSFIEYGRLLIYISEAYDSMGNYQEAINLIQKYKEKAFGINDENIQTIEQKQILSEIYNRLHVYHRHQVAFPIENKKIMRYLNLATKIADDIEYTMMQYVNYSDMGYLYYDLPMSDIQHVNTIFYWKKACEIYENGGAEAKELNYLRKKVQLALLKGESEIAIHTAEIGLEQIEFSTHTYQQTFFRWWFYHALAESYLLSYTVENSDNIEKALERANFYSELLNSNKNFYYLQLKSVYLFYLGKKADAIIVNAEAIKLVESSNYKMKKNSLKRQLQENEVTLLSNASALQKNLYSQIHTTDLLFNLPCM